ncbi:hypothetical protein BC941DRAFT_176326 [Chlamydoabsidia padenii]|nr:hypothetical protein BC941DRAFT_176326 [Chlamydoabsidia padenii]
MLSLYSGLDMNYTQTFPTYFGLARSRVDSFDLQQALCQQQQQQPQTSPTYSPTNMVTSSVSLVEPMIQSTLTMMPASNTPTPSLSSTSTSSSSVTSNSAIYYDAYPSTYTPNIDLSTSSTTSPSINDSWAHTTPTNLLPQSTYNYSFTSPLPSALPVQQDQQFSYTPTSSSYDTSQLRYHQKEEPQSYSACAITHSPVYDPVPPLLYPHGYHQHHSYQYNDIFTQSAILFFSHHHQSFTRQPLPTDKLPTKGSVISHPL